MERKHVAVGIAPILAALAALGCQARARNLVSVS